MWCLTNMCFLSQHSFVVGNLTCADWGPVFLSACAALPSSDTYGSGIVLPPPQKKGEWGGSEEFNKSRDWHGDIVLRVVSTPPWVNTGECGGQKEAGRGSRHMPRSISQPTLDLENLFSEFAHNKWGGISLRYFLNFFDNYALNRAVRPGRSAYLSPTSQRPAFPCWGPFHPVARRGRCARTCLSQEQTNSVFYLFEVKRGQQRHAAGGAAFKR